MYYYKKNWMTFHPYEFSAKASNITTTSQPIPIVFSSLRDTIVSKRSPLLHISFKVEPFAKVEFSFKIEACE